MDFLQEFIQSGSMVFPVMLCGLGVAAYVLQALALHTIAKRRGLRCPWLAWVPVADGWILGAVSDQYRKTVLHKRSHRRGILLGLNIAAEILGILYVVLMFVGLFRFGPAYDGSVETEYGAIGWVPIILGVLVLLLLCMLPLIVLLIVKAVFRWMSIWDVFKSCDPRNAQLYFLVGFLLGLFKISGLETVFMVVCMNKDDGMTAPTSEEPVQV